MKRAAVMAVVGRTEFPPTEAMWEELEAELERLRVETSPGYPMTDLEFLGTVPVKTAAVRLEAATRSAPDRFRARMSLSGCVVKR